MKKILMLNLYGNEQEDCAFVRFSLGELGLIDEQLKGSFSLVESVMQDYIGSYKLRNQSMKAFHQAEANIHPVYHSINFSASQTQQGLTTKILDCYRQSEKHAITNLEARTTIKSRLSRSSCATFFLTAPKVDPNFLLLDAKDVEEHYDALSALLSCHFKSKVVIPIFVRNLNRFKLGLCYKMLRDVGVRLSDASDYSIDKAQFIDKSCVLYEELLPANQAIEAENQLSASMEV